MKVELKVCFEEKGCEHSLPYLEKYQWEDRSESYLPACCVYQEIGIEEFPTTIKTLIEMKFTNNLTQMVSGIYSSELMQVDENLYFISFYDIDEAPTECFFIKETIDLALHEYLKLTGNLEIPFMNIFYAIEQKMLGLNGLQYGWTPASIFSKNENLAGLQLRVKVTGLNSRLQDLINKVGLDRTMAEEWRKSFLEGPVS
jgi:hypothetical protein